MSVLLFSHVAGYFPCPRTVCGPAPEGLGTGTYRPVPASSSKTKAETRLARGLYNVCRPAALPNNSPPSLTLFPPRPSKQDQGLLNKGLDPHPPQLPAPLVTRPRLTTVRVNILKRKGPQKRRWPQAAGRKLAARPWLAKMLAPTYVLIV